MRFFNIFFFCELLAPQRLDYSIESLRYLDEYLGIIHREAPSEDDSAKIALRCGAYLGEVVRRNVCGNYNWIEFKQVIKINKSIEQYEFHLGTACVLWSEPDSVIFPIGRVLNFMENGAEDSLYFYAKVVCKELSA